MLFAVTFARPERASIDVGRLLDDTLRELGMTHKEAWIEMGCRDGAEFSRAMKGERPLDLWDFAKLPWRVQASFWSKYIAAQATRLTDDLKADRMRMVRFDQASDSQKERVG